MTDPKMTDAEEFERFFGGMMADLSERGYSTLDVMNALGCSMALLAMASEDPRGYMAEVTGRMNEYVALLEERAEKIAEAMS